MTTQVDLLPRKLATRLEDFMKAGGTGKVTLHVKDGSVLAWTLEESGNG